MQMKPLKSLGLKKNDIILTGPGSGPWNENYKILEKDLFELSVVVGPGKCYPSY